MANKVLLVDDEAGFTQLLKMNLEKSGGYEVMIENDSTQAFSTALEFEPDAIVLDVVMPGMNGKDLADHLLSQKPDLKVLFMSGYTADVIASRGVVEKGVNFLGKPFTREELALKVRKTLDN
jgi:DNA-binding response OmpR family regulator